MSINPYSKIKIPSVEDYTQAVVTLDERAAQANESVTSIIEDEAASHLHREIKIQLGFAARDMLSRVEWGTDRHMKLCRALGLGGYTGYLIAKNVYPSLEFFNIDVQPARTYIDPADYRLLVAERSRDTMDTLGESVELWLDARSREITGIDEPNQFWYTVGATEALNCVRSVAQIKNGQ